MRPVSPLPSEWHCPEKASVSGMSRDGAALLIRRAGWEGTVFIKAVSQLHTSRSAAGTWQQKCAMEIESRRDSVPAQEGPFQSTSCTALDEWKNSNNEGIIIMMTTKMVMMV